jgi:hypothetical protein
MAEPIICTLYDHEELLEAVTIGMPDTDLTGCGASA